MTSPPLEPLAYRPVDLVRMLRLSRAQVYLMLRRGDLPTVRVGRAVLVPASAVRQLLGEAGGCACSGGGGR